jgi:hypothetical protein
MDPMLGAGLGMILGEYNDNRQYDQQKRLQGMQIEGNKEMANYSQQKQKEMWDYTNYENQKKHMKNAGLNPALMYGMGGGGGSSLGSGASGSVSGASAPMGGNEIKQGVEIGMQLKAQTELLQAQKEGILLDNKKKLEEIPNIKEGTETKVLENKWERWLQSKESGMGEQSIKEKGAYLEQSKIQAGLNEVEENIKRLKANTGNIIQNTANQKQVFEQLEKMNPLQLQEYQKKLELYLNDPNNTEGAQWAKMLLSMIGQIGGIIK